MIVEAQKDIEVVGEASDGREAVAQAAEVDPRRDGAPGDLMAPTFDLDEYVYEAMKASASGFLLRDVRPEQLAEAVRVVAAGKALLAPAITQRLIEEYVRRPLSGSGRTGRTGRAHGA